LAPGGWGFPPGYLLSGRAELPDLDLSGVKGRVRNDLLVEALLPLRHFASIKAADLQKKYGLAHVTAHAIIKRIERG